MSQLLPMPGKVYMLKHIKLPVSSSTRTIVVPGGPSEPLRDFHPNIVESLFSRKVSDGEKQSQETSIWRRMSPLRCYKMQQKEAWGGEQSPKKLNRAITWPSHSAPCRRPRRIKKRDSNRCLYTRVHSHRTQPPKGGNNPRVHQQLNG